MFTGIIEEVGIINSITPIGDGIAVGIDAHTVVRDAEKGASIAVDGVCLTVTDFTPASWTCFIMRETLNNSTLGNRVVGDKVNLERAMRADTRFGGHVVEGHVDCTSTIHSVEITEQQKVLRCSLAPEHAGLVVHKGSIAINGTSLTVSTVGLDFFEVSLIPTTRALTNLDALAVGDEVNLEFNVMGKYLARFFEVAQALPV
ncbi:riboflavin synthase [Corynebacterium felinum]|uniref:Riboflavin synthase n=1 Tax=Corynebacterium felinum TaxID=131318 RepID=A0ABU2BAS4_9CORY|nr:riboflavin synthase [Corynebacterium felinum]MDF5821964.1 riboflavin synthase [Corynebacterium felinum]MDR7355742.1 riboflavin synthase [Corynebacterium felinum]WJY95090.1 Riboflavin synthase [Corynebacterium felinum]